MARRQRKQRMTPRLLAFMFFLGMGAIAIIIAILKSIVDYFKKNPDSGLILLTVMAICFVSYLLLKKINESSLEKAQIRELEEAEDSKRLEEIKRTKEVEIKKLEDARKLEEAEESKRLEEIKRTKEVEVKKLEDARKLEEAKRAQEAKIKESYLISIIFDYNNDKYRRRYLAEFPWNKILEIIDNSYKKQNLITSRAEFTFKEKNKLRAKLVEHIFTPLCHYYRFEKKNDTSNELVKTIEEGMREQKVDEANSETFINFLADNIFTIANHSYVLKVINDTKRTVIHKYHNLSIEDFKKIEFGLKNLFSLLSKDEICFKNKLMATIDEISRYQYASEMLPEIKKMIDNRDMIGAKALYLSVYDRIDLNIYNAVKHNGLRVNPGWNLETILGVTYDQLLRGQAETVPQTKTIENYIDHCDGTITDTKTGLMWKKYCEGPACWNEALKRVKSNNNQVYAGYSDWRLPNIDELRSLMDTKFKNPMINHKIFTDTPFGLFWSSTQNNNGLMGINFFMGCDDWRHNGSSNFVRIVRTVLQPEKTSLLKKAQISYGNETEP